MKAWLKGGLIGGIIGFILTVFNGIVIYLALAQEAGRISMNLSLWNFFGSIFKSTSLISFLPVYLSRFFTPFVFLTPIFGIAVLFVAGALIGWLYGKIKERKK